MVYACRNAFYFSGLDSGAWYFPQLWWFRGALYAVKQSKDTQDEYYVTASALMLLLGCSLQRGGEQSDSDVLWSCSRCWAIVLCSPMNGPCHTDIASVHPLSISYAYICQPLTTKFIWFFCPTLLPSPFNILFISVITFYLLLRVSLCPGLSFDLPVRGFLNLEDFFFFLVWLVELRWPCSYINDV